MFETIYESIAINQLQVHLEDQYKISEWRNGLIL